VTPRGHRSLAGVPGSPGVHPEGTPGDTIWCHPPLAAKTRFFSFLDDRGHRKKQQTARRRPPPIGPMGADPHPIRPV